MGCSCVAHPEDRGAHCRGAAGLGEGALPVSGTLECTQSWAPPSGRKGHRAGPPSAGVLLLDVGQVPSDSGLRVLQPPGRPGLGALRLEGPGRTCRSWRAWGSRHQLLGENETTRDEALWRPAQTRAGRVSGSSSPSVVCERVRFLVLLVSGVSFVVCTSASPASLGTSLLTFSLDLEGHLLHRTWVHSDLSPQAAPASP